MQITIEAIGTKPFTPHNVDLANPRNPWYRKMSDLRGTPSKGRTDKWLDEMEYAMFMGAFYDIPEIDGVGIPAENMRQSLIEAAKMTRLGTKAKQAIMLTTPAVPLIYTGPRTPQELWDDGGFKLTRMIRGSGGASPTTWPIFSEWALRVPFELDEKTINVAALRDVAERAGQVIGIGASRKQGYGRYAALVKTS
jgi:hypothetical protein